MSTLVNSANEQFRWLPVGMRLPQKRKPRNLFEESSGATVLDMIIQGIACFPEVVDRWIVQLRSANCATARADVSSVNADAGQDLELSFPQPELMEGKKSPYTRQQTTGVDCSRTG